MRPVILFFFVVGATIAVPLKKPHFFKGKPRITGGQDTTYGQFPYQLTLQDGSFGFYYHICGAILYSADYAITSGHCVYQEDIANPSYLQVVAGDFTLYIAEGNEQSRSLASIVINENFNWYTYSNDVALLKVQSSFTFNTYVQSIALPASGQTSSGDCTLTGWGDTSENGDPPTVLQQISLPVVTDSDCRVVYGTPDVEDSMLCAGGEDGKGGCQGDSGGPLTCDDGSGNIYLAGIASWGYKCGLAGYPDVFAEVSYFVDWIQTNAV